MANIWNSGWHCGELQGMPHKWWKVPRCNYLYNICSIGLWRIKCQRSWASEKSWWGCCNISTDTYFSTSTSRCDQTSQQVPAESISLQFQSCTQHQHGGQRKLSCTSQWGWNNLSKLHDEIFDKRWGTCAYGEVGKISAWY